MITARPARADSPDPVSAEPVVLRADGISKHFAGVQALNGVSFELRRGEVHALAGANGAGKSTLLKIFAGLIQPDSGSISIDGSAVAIAHPTDASRLGMTFVHQDLNLVPHFNAWQNMMVGHPDASRGGMLNRKGMRQRARRIFADLDVSIDVDRPVQYLAVHEQWMVSLARALMRDAKIVAMDEPSGAFTGDEVEKLFKAVRTLSDRGTAIIYVSHRLEEILEICSVVTVLRESRLVGTFPVAELDTRELAYHIAGRRLDDLVPAGPVHASEQGPLLSVRAVTRAPAVNGVSFDLYPGEVLGVAGLVGSGRTELARVIFGLDRPTSGTMTIGGRPYRPANSFEAMRAGVGLVPEDRRKQGLITQASVAENVSLASNGSNRISRWLPLISLRQRAAAARDMIGRLSIKTPSDRTRVAFLSGGNQQKVVVAKWLRTNPRILILDEPTLGVDVGARQEIYTLITRLASEGTAVILISSDFEELGICQRIIALREGRLVGELDGRAPKYRLTELCYSTEEAS